MSSCIKTRLLSASGKFYGITDFTKAVEFRFTDDGNLFPYYNLHKACDDKRKRKNVNKTCIQIGGRCHCVKILIPQNTTRMILPGVSERIIYMHLQMIFDNVEA